MGLKVEIDPEDSFSALISLFLNCNKITQEQFAHKILTTRQSISSLMSINSITEVSESMLFRLYYYFKEVYDSIENQKKANCL